MRLGRKGFTLTELIVVIVIIGVLAAMAVPAMTANIGRAKRAEAISVLGSLRTAQKLYYTENGAYAGSIPPLSAYIPISELNGRYHNSLNYATDGNMIYSTATAVDGGSTNINISTGVVDNP